MSKEFKRFSRECWKRPFGFVVIDLTSKRDEGKYRCKFDEFYICHEEPHL